MLAKTSRGPYSSSFMMTKSLPQPVSMRCGLAGEQLRARRARGGDAAGAGSRLALLLGLADVEHLLVAAAVAVDGDALAAGLVGQQVDLLDVVDGGLVGEVDRLGDGVVGVLLEGRLQLDVPLGRDVVRRDEDALHVGSGTSSMWRTVPSLGDLLHELVGVEPRSAATSSKYGLTSTMLVVVQHVARARS